MIIVNLAIKSSLIGMDDIQFAVEFTRNFQERGKILSRVGHVVRGSWSKTVDIDAIATLRLATHVPEPLRKVGVKIVGKQESI